MNNVEIWLWILLVMLPHNERTAKLLKKYDTALDAAKAMRDGQCDLLTPQEKQRVERTRTREVRGLINECERLGIRIVTLDDAEYPPQLKQIADPPIVLFVKGDLAPLHALPSLAVVGPRSPSEYGRNAADVFCTALAKDRVALISGLAVGIDSIVHRRAVNNGGYTVGVMGCGLSVNYPAENQELKDLIIRSGGAIISELLPYASVTGKYFKHRNRIISGLGSGTLIIEASTKSGCLLTAKHTLAQKRPLLCIPPHDVFEERFSGVVPLLRKGAINAFDISDIYRELNSSQLATPQIADAVKRLPASKATTPPSSSDSSIVCAEQTEPAAEKTVVQEKPEPNLTALSPEEASVVSQLQENPLTMDELIDKTELSHDKICSIVLGLELRDVITRNRDGTFSIV